MRPFNRGLKTLITAFLVVMFAVAFLTPAISASQWDPKSPPVYPWIDGNRVSVEHDDTPWEVEQKSSYSGSWPYDSFSFWIDSFLYSIGVQYIIFEGTTTSPVDSDVNTDIQSGANNGSN